MKNALFLLLITLAVVINTASAAEDSNSTDMEKRVRELQKKSMKRRPSNVDRERKDAELNKLQGLNREERREKMRELREKRIREAEATRATRAKNKGIDLRNATPEQTPSLDKIKTQLRREDQKHLKRLSKLNRIKLLATEGNNQKTIDRVDKLIAKEKRRYANKHQRVQNRQRMLERLKAREKAMKGPDTQQLTKEAIEKARKKKDLEPKNKPEPIENK